MTLSIFQPKPEQDAGISREHREEWRGIPETFPDQDEGEIPDDNNNAWNTMDLEMKNEKRASGYKSFKPLIFQRTWVKDKDQTPQTQHLAELKKKNAYCETLAT